MKKTGAIACLAMLIVMLTASFSFGAEALQVTRTFPEDGAKGTTKDNMCVKVYFNNDVGNDVSRKANEDKFQIVDENGKSWPSVIYYSDKNPKYALILIDTTKVKTTGKNSIKDNTEYTCTIKAGFTDNKGNKLSQDYNVTFRTLNQGRNTMIYMVMMVLMFGGMMLFTFRQQAKAKEEENSKEEKEETFNPYKEAKRTGKSVQEVIAEHEKEVAKKEAQKKAKAKKKKELEEYFEDDNDNYRVHRPRPISEAGSTYKTGRKAIAEAKAAEEARLKAEKKAELKATNYGKNPKKGK